jgi:diguanylate cyclase (GGDEF)-like protein
MIGPLRRLVSTRVSRRLFFLFVLSAFVPLAAIALLSLTQMRALLLQQGDQRLAATAKTYGMSVFERLLMAGDVAAAAAFDPEGRRPPDALALRTFSSLAIVTADKSVTLFGPAIGATFPPEARGRLASGNPVVRLIGDPRAPRVLLASPLPPPSASIVLGELKPEYLWGPDDELPAATDFCTYEEGSRLWLYCSGSIDPAVLEMVSKPFSTTLESATWNRDGETYRARAWTQFMRASFGTADWVVVATQPQDFQLVRATEFRRQYVPVIALALLLATWFTIRQSRNIVGPVTQLAERARGIARQDFDTRLNLTREDEFGELGAAFDQMSRTLGRQFASLTTLSEIDRLILTTQDTTQVLRLVLQRLRQVVPAELATITLFEHDNPERARTYFAPPQNPDSFSMARHEVAAADRSTLTDGLGGRWMTISPDARLPGYLDTMRDHGIRRAYVEPIVWRDTVCGALAFGYRQESIISEEERRRAQELADRVAVAVSSAWREEQLYLQAHFDPLTGLPNRHLFKDRLDREIARSQRAGVKIALLFIDLDHFKNVNDSFGHTMGDGVLREAAQRIARCIREADTVARLGGDEFTVMLTSLDHAQDAWLISEAIVAALSREYVLGEQRCFLSASVGIASYPADGSSAEELLKSADTAMYRAKANGRAQGVFFEEKMNRETLARMNLDRDLRMAIERGELVMHYQPQVNLATGEIRGAEALLRWKHPIHGLISPLRFIPLAEESGFIDPLGQWTVRQVCAQIKAWRAEGFPVDRISVNVSPRQFRRRVVEFIRACVTEAQIPAASLEIEITEGLLMDAGSAVESMLRELAAMGHGIALDDFGTGFSSMAYLKRYPVHTIKIDRVFIDGLERSADSEAIVAAIIAMSHALGKSVIAEGVETAEQLALLRKLRCDEMQGFLFSPALPHEEFAAMVRARSTLATA